MLSNESALNHAVGRIKDGAPSDRVIAELIEMGASEEAAQEIVYRVVAMKRDEKARDIAMSLLDQGKTAAQVWEALVATGMEHRAAEALVMALVKHRQYLEDQQRLVQHQEALDAAARQRPRYDANVHVFLGAALQVAAVGGLIMLCGEALASRFSWAPGSGLPIFLFLGIPAGFITSVLTYWGRWQRTEEYSSRFCSGALNISILYVPLIALLYANMLFLRDLIARRRPTPASR